MRSAWRALRPHQWAKNLLLFVPPLAAHRLLEPGLFFRAGLAFIAFSLCASSVYVFNDLLDIEADRRHPTKRHRPFAAGLLSIRQGLLLGASSLAVALAFAWLTLPFAFVLLLAGYFLCTLAYSFFLKRLMVVDVLLLAGLYTVRLFAGSLSVGVRTSSWLFTFSMFLFLSLALVKRFSEVRQLGRVEGTVAPGRGYHVGDDVPLGALGMAAGYVSILVLALYITSDEVTKLYSSPQRLWALCLLMLYWVSRLWLLAYRGRVQDDPLLFALRDRASYAVALLCALLVFWAS